MLAVIRFVCTLLQYDPRLEFGYVHQQVRQPRCEIFWGMPGSLFSDATDWCTN